jgi:hypothetical protein
MVLRAHAVVVGARVRILGQHDRAAKDTARLDDRGVPVGDRESAPGLEGGDHDLDGQVLDWEP